MKTIQLVALAILGGLVLSSCTEEEKAAMRVMRKNASQMLVEQVGKADTALELYKKEYRMKKEAWIKMKQMGISYTRRAEEAKAAAAQYREAGKENLALLKEQEAEKYASRVALFNEREAKVEASFKEYQTLLEEKKVALQILKDEVAALRAMGGLSDDLQDDATEERLESARELEESIKMDCDRAQATIDVNMSM